MNNPADSPHPPRAVQKHRLHSISSIHGGVLWICWAVSDRDAARQAYEAGVSLVNANLRGFDLTHLCLDGIRLDGADLTGARLSGSSLRKASLRGARIDRTTLTRTVLAEADLEGVLIFAVTSADEADFTRANLASAEIVASTLRRARFDSANMRNARLVRTNLAEATLRSADLSVDDGRRVGFAKVTLAGATADHASFAGRELVDVRFAPRRGSRTSLRYANFEGAKLFRVNLDDTNALGATFENATLTAVHASNANLSRSRLRRARVLSSHIAATRLRGADLDGSRIASTNLANIDLGPTSTGIASSARDAVVENSHLVGAILRGIDAAGVRMLCVDLSEADLGGASFQRALLERVKIDAADVAGLRLDGAEIDCIDASPDYFAGAEAAAARFRPFQLDLLARIAGPAGVASQPREATLAPSFVDVPVCIPGTTPGTVAWESVERVWLDGLEERATPADVASALAARTAAEANLGNDPSAPAALEALVLATREYERVRKARQRWGRAVATAALHLALARAVRGGTSLARVDLSGANLSGVDLRGIDLREANLSRSKLLGTNLSQADLTGADLREAVLGINVDDAPKAVLLDASLVGADLTGARCQQVRFDGSDLEGIIARGAYMVEASFFNARLERADFSPADGVATNLSRADFEQAYAVGTVFRQIEGRSVKFTRAVVDEADFTAASLPFSSFRHAIGPDVVLAEVNLTDADLSESSMARADLDDANLLRTDLSHADLSSATIAGSKAYLVTALGASLPPEDVLAAEGWVFAGSHASTDFRIMSAIEPGVVLWEGTACGFGAAVEFCVRSNVRLDGADLRYADLAGLDLSHALLDRASLRGARLDEADLSNARLRSASLEGASARGCNFASASLDRAVLSYANVEGANFERARLRGASVYGLAAGVRHIARIDDNVYTHQRVVTRFTGGDLSGVEGAYATFDGALFDRARLDDAVLSHSSFDGANLAGAWARNVRLEHVVARRARFDGARFSGRVSGSSFVGASFEAARLRGLAATKCNFARASLAASDARASDLSGCGFALTDFSEANLTSVRFVGSNLEAAVLVGACIEGAHFDRANSSGANFDRVRCDAGTSFSGANLAQASMRGLDLGGVGFDGFDSAVLDDVDFAHSTCDGASLAEVLARVRPAAPSADRLEAVRAAEQQLCALDGRVLWKGPSRSIREAVEQAARDGFSLAGVDLSGQELDSLTLVGVDLTGAKLDRARLMDANLVNCNFEGASIREVRLDRADLGFSSGVGAKLDGACLDNANLQGGRFDSASMIAASLRMADLTDVSLVGADLTGVTAPGARFCRAELVDAQCGALACDDGREWVHSGADFAQADFSRAGLVRTVFDWACLDGAIFHEAELDDTSFRRASIRSTDLRTIDCARADFTAAQFDGSLLPEFAIHDRAGTVLYRCEALSPKAGVEAAIAQGVSLARAVLPGIDLRGARLDNAVFDGADLSTAVLFGASLKNASVCRANLRRADLRGVDSTGTDLATAMLGDDVTPEAALAGAFGASPRPRVSSEPLPPVAGSGYLVRRCTEWRERLFDRVGLAMTERLKRTPAAEEAHVRDIYRLLDDWLREPGQSSVRFLTKHAHYPVRVLLTIASHEVERLHGLLRGNATNNDLFPIIDRPQPRVQRGGDTGPER